MAQNDVMQIIMTTPIILAYPQVFTVAKRTLEGQDMISNYLSAQTTGFMVLIDNICIFNIKKK